MDDGGIQGVQGPTGSFSATFPGSLGGWLPDPQLTNYLVNNQNTSSGGSIYHNASILEFDFVSFADSISFNFIFASNEYTASYACSFSDSFAFFLEDEDGVVQNIAILKDEDGNIIPGIGGDEIPISVLTIRDNSLIGAPCSDENPDLYIHWGANNANAPINCWGQTVKLQAWSYVQPYQTYRMKMVIQDRSDTSVDSAVFIEGGSFFIGQADLGDDITFDHPDSDCYGNPIKIEVEEFADCEYIWRYAGEIIEGADSHIYYAPEPGEYCVEIICGGIDETGCTLEDCISVEFRVTPELSSIWNDETIYVCDPDFEIELVATPNNLTELHQISYDWYQNGVQLPHTGSSYLVTESGTYTVVVAELGCGSSGTVTVELVPEFAVELGDDMEDCGVLEYQLVANIESDETLDTNEVSYLWSTGETSPSITVTDTDLYWVEVTYFGCVETDDIFVVLADAPEISLGDETMFKCPNEDILLSVTFLNEVQGDVQYTWFYNGGVTGGNSPELSVSDYGIYKVEVEVDGCIEEAEIEVVPYANNENCVITQGLSPGGSLGQNDSLDLQFLSDRTGISVLQIFNRHGLLVYEHRDYRDEWEGQGQGGEELPTGTYFYVIHFSGSDPIYGSQTNGWIYINRDMN